MRIVTSNSAPSAGRRVPGNPRDAAARAAIEREYSRYIPLNCGHFTDLETDSVYSLWRPKGRGIKRRSYCENCSKWQLIKWPPAVSEEIAEPLF